MITVWKLDNILTFMCSTKDGKVSMASDRFFLKIDFSHENKTFKTWGNSLQLPYAYGQKFHPMWSKLP